MTTTTTIAAVGGTGVGKSTTMNSIAGRRVFEEGCGLASVTQATQRHDDAARDLTLYDVPGLDDPAGPAADAAHTADMVKRLVGHGHVHLFAVCFNGASPRLTSSLQQQLALFGAVFGAGFLANVVLVFTHWGRDAASARRRERSGETEASRAAEMNGAVRALLGALPSGDADLPAVFLDNDPDPDAADEVAAHRAAVERIVALARAKAPFACADIQPAPRLPNQALQDGVDEARAALARERAAREAAEREAERQRAAAREAERRAAADRARRLQAERDAAAAEKTRLEVAAREKERQRVAAVAKAAAVERQRVAAVAAKQRAAEIERQRQAAARAAAAERERQEEAERRRRRAEREEAEAQQRQRCMWVMTPWGPMLMRC